MKPTGAQPKQPRAPAIYRPQPLQKCLQPKSAGGLTQSPAAARVVTPSRGGQRLPAPIAAPAKTQRTAPFAGNASSAGPAVNRRQSMTGVLQKKNAIEPVNPRAAAKPSLNRSPNLDRHGSVGGLAVNRSRMLTPAPPKLARTPMAPSRTVQRAEEKGSRQEKAAAKMVWNEDVPITRPAPKHVLEEMNASDAKGKMKCSVVTKAVMEDAVRAIGAHVKQHGWNSAGNITIEWIPAVSCYKITYAGNEWMTHSSSGQIWPLRGTDIFSPPEGLDVSKMIKKWKGSKTPPGEYYG
ncbi:MAG TPA: hypothetical protein VE961_00075 [Pyrinomonadaceae bacterium]|nr:hypothetical protein [Pyrinomonadaceae bacterium]